MKMNPNSGKGSRKGRLTPKKVMVTKNGKTFEQTVYVSNEVEVKKERPKKQEEEKEKRVKKPSERPNKPNKKSKEDTNSRSHAMEIGRKMTNTSLIEGGKEKGFLKESSGNDDIDRMRILTAMKQHVDKGGKISEGKNKEEKEEAEQSNGLENMSLERAFKRLGKRGKVIANLTGIVPLDETAEKYLLENIKNDVYVDPKLLERGQDKLEGMASLYFFNYKDAFKGEDSRNNIVGKGRIKEILPKEFHKQLEEYENKDKEMKEEHGRYHKLSSSEAVRVNNTAKILKKYHENGTFKLEWGKTGEEYASDITNLLNNMVEMEDDDFNEAWNELNFNFIFSNLSQLSMRISQEQNPLMAMLYFAMPSSGSSMVSKIAKEYEMSEKEFQTKFADIPKRDLIDVLAEVSERYFDKQSKFEGDWNNPIIESKQKAEKWGTKDMHNFIMENTEGKEIVFDKVNSKMNKLLKDKLYFESDETKLMEFNAGLSGVIADTWGSDSKQAKAFKGVDMNTFKAFSREGEKLAVAILQGLDDGKGTEEHIRALERDKDPNTREGMLKRLKEGKLDEIGDISEVPNLKTSLKTASKKQYKDAVKQMNEANGENYSGYSVTVNNVFIIGNQNNREAYENIEGEEHKNLLFRCSSPAGWGRFLGQEGQFKVFKGGNATLGHGIYLAEEPKHALRFIHDNGQLDGVKGTMFGCVAKLGEIKEAKNRSFDDNQKLLDDGADTVYIGGETYKTPEYNVKNHDAVYVKYYYDVEMKAKK